MSELVPIQLPKSLGEIAEELRQLPKSFPAKRRYLSGRPQKAAPTSTSFRRPERTQVELPVSAPTELEEYFEGYVTEIQDEEIRLSTTSSSGEEGDAWLPISNIPQDERTYVGLGVPVRISIFVRTTPNRERVSTIRFLRKDQWMRPTAEEAAPAVDLLVERIKQVLGER